MLGDCARGVALRSRRGRRGRAAVVQPDQVDGQVADSLGEASVSFNCITAIGFREGCEKILLFPKRAKSGPIRAESQISVHTISTKTNPPHLTARIPTSQPPKLVG